MSLFSLFEPARRAGYGVHLKNLYNLYVYFIRWSLWKVFEHKTATGPGILSFITASSYLDGDAFVGLREHMRRICDHIDIIDLGGEGRGTRKNENVFAIQTPVAIFIAWRKAKPNPDNPAIVRYTRIEGTREEKLKALDAVTSSNDMKWESVPSDWQASFKPEVQGVYSKWPIITDLFPWQHSGVECKRTWPIECDREVLKSRWKGLLISSDRATAMKESGDRTISLSQIDLFDSSQGLPAIKNLANNQPVHTIVPYAFRSFDRQYLLADSRLISRPRPNLWLAYSAGQIHLTSLFNHPLGGGPAITVCSNIPDRHHFRGSYGGKDIFPLYRDAARTQPNILPGLLDMLSKEFSRRVTPEDFAGYVYGVLAQPEYTQRFADELANKEVRVPLTKDKELFAKVSEFGKELIWLHTYGERLSDAAHPKGQIPKGEAQCIQAVSDQENGYPNEFNYDEDSKKLHVGDGVFAPVKRGIIGVRS